MNEQLLEWQNKAAPLMSGEDFEIVSLIRSEYEKEIEEFADSIAEKYKEQELDFYKRVYANKSKKK